MKQSLLIALAAVNLYFAALLAAVSARPGTPAAAVAGSVLLFFLGAWAIVIAANTGRRRP